MLLLPRDDFRALAYIGREQLACRVGDAVPVADPASRSGYGRKVATASDTPPVVPKCDVNGGIPVLARKSIREASASL